MEQNRTPELRAEAAAAAAPPIASTEKNLCRWAARMVRERDDLLAVVLFGSRARGTARPDSDWDLALIAETGQPDARPAAVPELGDQVQAISIPPCILRSKRNAPGHIARNVLLDGRLLAGTLPAVGKIRRNPPMQPQEFQRMSSSILQAVEIAGAGFANAAEAEAEGEFDSCYASAVSFVQFTAGTVEHLAKLMLFRRGLQPARTHDIHALAKQLESAGPGSREDEVARIRAMNGETSRHHQAACLGVTPDDVRHAAGRLRAFSRTVSEEFREAAHSPALERVANRQLTVLCQAASMIHERLTPRHAVPTTGSTTADIFEPASPAVASAVREVHTDVLTAFGDLASSGSPLPLSGRTSGSPSSTSGP